MLFHSLNTNSCSSLQKEKYPLQAFLSYLNNPATTAQRLKIFLGLGLGPKKPKYCNTIIKKLKTIFNICVCNKYLTNETTNNSNGNSIDPTL